MPTWPRGCHKIEERKKRGRRGEEKVVSPRCGKEVCFGELWKKLPRDKGEEGPAVGRMYISKKTRMREERGRNSMRKKKKGENWGFGSLERKTTCA